MQHRLLQLTLSILLSFLFQVAPAQAPQSIKAGTLSIPAGNHTIPFRWEGKAGSFNALLLPVTLPGCPKTFYMQFDLGSSYTLFYGNKIRAIRSRYPEVPGEDSTAHIASLSFLLEKLAVKGSGILVRSFDSSGINWSLGSVEIIGTIGSDLIADRPTLIDYPGGAIRLGYEAGASTAYRDLVWVQGNILLPAVIRGKKTMLHFDTGSSAFALLTDKATCSELALPGAPVQEQQSRSWDRVLKAYTVATGDSIALGGKLLPLGTASYIEGASAAQIEGMKRMGIGGMTGNRLFLCQRLLLDTKRRRFALLQVRGKSPSPKCAVSCKHELEPDTKDRCG
jgi:hypothetical protein